jgi:vacuolar-type H+-ATPase subunit I/STV1
LFNCLGQEFGDIEEDLRDYESVSFDSVSTDSDNFRFDEEHVVENDLNMRRVTINTTQSSPKSLRRKLKKIRKQTARLFDNLDRNLEELGDIEEDQEM